MGNGKSIIIDTSRCTGCRGCQVACKQWNGLPGTKTKQWGSYQNPPDFSAETYKVVRFSEGLVPATGKPYWYFFSDMCRHCIEPGCKVGADKGEIIQDQATGAVVFTDKTVGMAEDIVRGPCPFDIPRMDAASKGWKKCTMCFDRITNGLNPACVTSCPTGSMVFGDRDEMLAEAKRRVEKLKTVYPKAQVILPDDVRVLFIVTDEPKKYYKNAAGL